MADSIRSIKALAGGNGNMDDTKGVFWTKEHLNSPAWGTDLILRKRDIIDDVRVHLTDIRDYTMATENDSMICWKYDGILWIEDKYATIIFQIEAQKLFLDSCSSTGVPKPVRAMEEHKLQELQNRKEFLAKLKKSGVMPDLISWSKLDNLMHGVCK